MFDVNVKDYQGNLVVIKVSPTWDIARVKQEILQYTQMAPQDFRLVYAGQTMGDSVTIKVGLSIAIDQ